MTWLLLTGAGLVAETVVIIVLGRTVTARYDLEDGALSDRAPEEGGRVVLGRVEERRRELAERMVEGGREAVARSRGEQTQLG